MKSFLGLLSSVIFLSIFCAKPSFARTPIWAKPLPGRSVTTDTPTPLFESGQSYLEASPTGVGARQAWNVTGGTGSLVKIIDVETCYETNHEDFNIPFYIGNNPKDQCQDVNHGTAVWGEMAAKRDGKGVTGIAYGAQYGVYGFIEGDLDTMSPAYIQGINQAIQGAMAHLSPGDVLVIEQEMSGPDGDTSVDYWPEIYSQLKSATDQGILCVEAAGNGGSNLDSDKYGGAFDLSKKDSGCIMVGAGDSQLNWLSFSNYGSRIDAFGYGTGVTTTGYGDLFNGGPLRMYTNSFNGTSSATPIVAGAVSVVSSVAKAKGRILTPLEVRAALRATGTAQNSSSQGTRIGSLPDIAAMIRFLGLQ